MLNVVVEKCAMVEIDWVFCETGDKVCRIVAESVRRKYRVDHEHCGAVAS